MKLILITTPTYFDEEDKIITALFEEGLDTLHLRKPDTAPMFAERLLTLIPEQYHKRIVVHGHFYLKDEYKLKGIHLNGRNPNPPENYKGHISCSCHSLDEVKERKQTCDYVFLSPVFNSISKMNYNSAYTAEELRAGRQSRHYRQEGDCTGWYRCGQYFRSKRLRLWRSSHLRCFVE